MTGGQKHCLLSLGCYHSLWQGILLTPSWLPQKLTRCHPLPQAGNACSESNRFSTDPWESLTDILFYLFCLLVVFVFGAKNFFSGIFFALKDRFFSVRSLISFFVIRKILLKVSSLATLVVLFHLSSVGCICSGNLLVLSI